ncbi:unnamed protein product [Laminaria digitata]
MDSLNSPALASPAASMIPAPERSHGGRQQYRQPNIARKGNQTPGRGGGVGGNGGGGGGGGASARGGYGRRGEFHPHGEGHVGPATPTNATAPALRPPPSPTASSIHGPSTRVYQRQASYPPPSGPALQATGWPSIVSAAASAGAVPPTAAAATPGPTTATASAAAAVSAAAGRPFQRPSSSWVSEESPRGPVSLPAPAAPLAIPSFASAHSSASLPLGPIGSNRLRARSNPDPAVGPVGGARRAPPGLTPPAQPMMHPFRPALAAPSPPPLTACDPTVEAEWSDNLDAFATASAVAAGVLSAEDMSDAAPFEDAGLLTGGVAAERWERYTFDAPGASARRQQQPGCFSPPGPSGDGDRRRTASDSRYGQGLAAFGGSEFVPGVGGGMFEDASGAEVGHRRHPSSQQHQQQQQQQQQLARRSLAGTVGAGCGVNGAGGRSAGGSRLGFYMSAAGAGSSSDRRVAHEEALPAGTLSFGSPEATLLFGDSSRSSLESSSGGGGGGGGGNMDDMFGFMNDCGSN